MQGRTRPGQALLGFLLVALPAVACAEARRGAFEVNIQVRRFSEPAVADHRCTHGGRAAGEPVVIRCPATVQVQTLARAAAGYELRQSALHMAADAPSARYRFQGDGPADKREPPIELMISW